MLLPDFHVVCSFHGLHIEWLQVRWHRFVDDFGCALFGPVLFVTLSYYGVQRLPLDPLYGDDYQVVQIARTARFPCHLSALAKLPI